MKLHTYLNFAGRTEEADRLFPTLSDGGTVEMPMADQVWGDYFGSFRDKDGVGWMINYPKTG